MKYSTKKKSCRRAKPYKRSGLSQVRPYPRRNQVVLPGHVGVGRSVTTNLRTGFFVNVTSAASGIFTGYLKPGSAFDPTGDLSTIQPIGFDLWAAAFNRYKVNKCWITLTISGVSSLISDGSDWVGAAYPAVDSTALVTYQGAASQTYAKTFHGRFGQAQTGATLIGQGGYSHCTRKFYIDNEAITGNQGTAYDIGALVTADPTNLQYSVLPIFLQANQAVASKFLIKVEMFQNVTFSNPKNNVDA